MWNEYRKEYKVRGGVELTGKGDDWHTNDEIEEEGEEEEEEEEELVYDY